MGYEREESQRRIYSLGPEQLEKWSCRQSEMWKAVGGGHLEWRGELEVILEKARMEVSGRHPFGDAVW